MKALLLIFPLVSFSLLAQEEAFQNVTENIITSEDEAKAETYIHHGIANKKVQEMCKDGQGGYKDICDEDKRAFEEGSTMRKLEGLVPALTKAYAMFNTVGGVGLTATKMKEGPDGPEPELDKEGNEQTENKTDYCGYIGMVGEAAQTAYTTMQNDKTEKNYKSEKPEARQAAAFYALADNHKTMAKGAKIQFGVWSATAGCYVVYATQAQYQGDWKVYAKMAAAGFIGFYYKKKADAHEERAKILNQMAKDLPQAGDCNPFTNKTCFCAEETSFSADPINFRNICIPQQLAENGTTTNEPYVCVAQNGDVDADCTCAKTNTCADKRLKIGGINLGLGPTVLKDPLKAMQPITKGFSGADVDAAANRNLARANKALKKFKPTSVPKLTNDQKKIAKELLKSGIPSATAAYLAKGFKGSGNAKAPSGALAGLSSAPLKRYNRTNSITPVKKANFKSGGSIRSASRKRSNPFNRYGKKKRTNKGAAIQIEDYVKKAEREAEIVNDTSKGIFDIISYRYKVRAWKEFKDSMVTEKESK